MDSKHGWGVVKFFILPLATAVPGWQYVPKEEEEKEKLCQYISMIPPYILGSSDVLKKIRIYRLDTEQVVAVHRHWWNNQTCNH